MIRAGSDALPLVKNRHCAHEMTPEHTPATDGKLVRFDVLEVGAWIRILPRFFIIIPHFTSIPVVPTPTLLSFPLYLSYLLVCRFKQPQKYNRRPLSFLYRGFSRSNMI
jgi:hypothetical protein